jgi:hypothetical protein
MFPLNFVIQIFYMMCSYTHRQRADICLRTAQGIDRHLPCISENVLVAQTCLFGYNLWFLLVPGFWAGSIFGIFDRNSFAFGLWMETFFLNTLDGNLGTNTRRRDNS